MEDAFGVVPRQHYGLAEGVANASECEEGRLHVDEDFSAVEFIPDNDGKAYRVIGTNLTNRAFSFLRYDTGDLVTLDPDTRVDGCSCGRPGRLIRRVDGRAEDYVVLKDGTTIGRLDHIFKDLERIKEAQIHQDRIGAVTIQIVPRAGFSEMDEQRLNYEARKRLGAEIDLEIQRVDRIERTSMGKLRFVISSVPSPLISKARMQ